MALKLIMLIQQGVFRSSRVLESKLKLTILSRSNFWRSSLDSEKALWMWALYFFIEKIWERHQRVRMDRNITALSPKMDIIPQVVCHEASHCSCRRHLRYNAGWKGHYILSQWCHSCLTYRQKCSPPPFFQFSLPVDVMEIVTNLKAFKASESGYSAHHCSWTIKIFNQ